ncbi:hypothetical protein BGZ60DRAFT_554388 [Tricladium varicosporioides]|nr:hypothetical protein BGZ60DRAFT_554388 [Hymenoscyphus varicosporioides]
MFGPQRLTSKQKNFHIKDHVHLLRKEEERKVNGRRGWSDRCTEKLTNGATQPKWGGLVEPQKVLQEKEEELAKERVAKALRNWPFNSDPYQSERLVTLAPWAENAEYQFALPQVKQSDSLLFTLLYEKIPDAFYMIIDLIFEHHDTACKFGITCQWAWREMKASVDFWDMTGGSFGHCDKPRWGPNASEKHQGSIAPVLIITPVRRLPVRRLEDVGKDISKALPVSFTEQAMNLKTMCIAINNFYDKIKNIQFHRAPLVTVNVLELLIPKMVSLTSLVDRLKGNERQVKLDFYPNYHQGPVEEEGNGAWCHGSFGPSWDNWNFNTCHAIWALVCNIIPKAQRQGIDFLGKHTMFRQWLDKSPCWRIEETLNALGAFLSGRNINTAVLAALLDCSNEDHYGDVTKYTRYIGNRAHGWKWSTQYFPCRLCPNDNNQKLGIFFHYPTQLLHKQRLCGDFDLAQDYYCLGCLLTHYLDNEADHYKVEKRNMIGRWLCDDETGEYNKTDLTKAIEEFDEKDILRDAQDIDDKRLFYIMRYGYDKETEERQKPRNQAELAKHGDKKRSPLVSAKFNDPKFIGPEEVKWYTSRKDRRNGNAGIW